MVSIRGLLLTPRTLLIFALMAPPASAATTRHMFVTSGVSGAHGGNLGEWLFALNGTSATGALAADGICRYFAGHSSLPGGLDPTHFRAWISTSTEDAFCRVRNDLDSGNGQVASSCGATPADFESSTGGPWVRTDGYPFAFDELSLVNHFATPNYLAGAVISPAALDESGNPVPYLDLIGTGSSLVGTGLPALTCDDWTLSSGGIVYGGLPQSTFNWESLIARDCGQSLHLICFEAGTNGPPLPAFEQPGELAFVSERFLSVGEAASWPGAVGTGVAAGDSVCRHEAAAAGMPHADSFRAWLSTGGASPATRLTTNGPWKRLDGALIANNKADLLDNQLFTSISVDTAGQYTDLMVWTGTSDGGVAGANCADWTSAMSSDTGVFGSSSTWVSGWSAHDTDECNPNGAFQVGIYCFGDSPPVAFWDSFERNGLARWAGIYP